MTEEIKNNIDELDGMVKIKGKCGYEIIGGCRELRESKQENKELKEKFNEAQDDIEMLTFSNNTYFKEIQELEQENKELRQQYNCYACDTCQGKEDYRNMKRHCENAIKTVHTYRSALEEIRILATKNVSIENFVKIQNKINEVLNESK